MDQRDWFKKLVETNANADEFARFFALPGMNHCGGGNGIDDVDPLSALEAWREQGTAPSSLLGKSTSRAGKQIKVCAYPKAATYVGGGENSASSFECR
jgi:flagellar biosynthetic protein fliQ